MKNIYFLILFFGCLLAQTSCNEDAKPETLEVKSDDDPSLPFDKRLKKYVEGSLRIPADENYKLKLYEEHLNDDGKKDIIITINRLENAIAKATQNGKVNKSDQLGFFGRHNYIIYYSTISNTFSKPIEFASTPQRELVLSFENISSETHKDLVVDYAIRNSQFRKIFLFIDDKPFYAFHWNLYDGWGTDELVANCFSYEQGSYSHVKDIVIKKGNMKNISKDDDYDTIEPEIECTDELIKRFFYNSKDGKYYTPN